MRHKTTRQADEDLIGIYECGYVTFGEAQAEKYFAELWACFKMLETNPLMGRERSEFSPPVRMYHHGRHLIVYIVEDDTVLIVRVLHDSMDVERWLG